MRSDNLDLITGAKQFKERKKTCIHYIGVTYHRDDMMEVVEEGITLTRALAHLKMDQPGYSVDWFKYCPRCGSLLVKRNE